MHLLVDVGGELALDIRDCDAKAGHILSQEVTGHRSRRVVLHPWVEPFPRFQRLFGCPSQDALPASLGR